MSGRDRVGPGEFFVLREKIGKDLRIVEMIFGYTVTVSGDKGEGIQRVGKVERNDFLPILGAGRSALRFGNRLVFNRQPNGETVSAHPVRFGIPDPGQEYSPRVNHPGGNARRRLDLNSLGTFR